MKRSNLLNLLFVALMCVGVAGCKKTPKGPTVIPPSDSLPRGVGPGGAIDRAGQTTEPRVGAEGIVPLSGGPYNPADFNEDREVFQSATAYFDFDSAAVKAGDKTKVESVASYFKGHAGDKLLIEGHCDERGTEGYNLSLGERRALALREYLVNLGVAADRIYTKSLGEARPAVQGHTEAAYSKNRRGEFILLKPK